MGDEKNILYGGPDPPLIDEEAKSLGEVILKKLRDDADDVMFVSVDKWKEQKRRAIMSWKWLLLHDSAECVPFFIL